MSSKRRRKPYQQVIESPWPPLPPFEPLDSAEMPPLPHPLLPQIQDPQPQDHQLASQSLPSPISITQIMSRLQSLLLLQRGPAEGQAKGQSTPSATPITRIVSISELSAHPGVQGQVRLKLQCNLLLLPPAFYSILIANKFPSHLLLHPGGAPLIVSELHAHPGVRLTAQLNLPPPPTFYSILTMNRLPSQMLIAIELRDHPGLRVQRQAHLTALCSLLPHPMFYSILTMNQLPSQTLIAIELRGRPGLSILITNQLPSHLLLDPGGVQHHHLRM